MEKVIFYQNLSELLNFKVMQKCSFDELPNPSCSYLISEHAMCAGLEAASTMPRNLLFGARIMAALEPGSHLHTLSALYVCLLDLTEILSGQRGSPLSFYLPPVPSLPCYAHWVPDSEDTKLDAAEGHRVTESAELKNLSQ